MKKIFFFCIPIFLLASCEVEECCDCTALPGEGVYCKSDFPENDLITWKDRKNTYIALGCECD